MTLKNNKFVNKTIHLAYYALLREERGIDQETIATDVDTATELYSDLQARYNFSLGRDFIKVDPKYTSQICSKCGKINKCNSKKYICSKCKLRIHRDENASYNIANRGKQALGAVGSAGQLTCPDSNHDYKKVKSKSDFKK